MDDNRSTVEIHPREGLKMDLVTDKWIRFCIGLAIVLMAVGGLMLAATPMVHAVRWW